MKRKISIRKKGSQGKKNSKPDAEARKRNATTMPIPVDALFDDLSHDHTIHLQVTIPGKKPFSVPLDKATTLIGRDAECEVYLPIDNVSREHAQILRNGEEFTVEDLESTNGTHVNNVRIVRCVLHPTDQISVGQARMNLTRVNLETSK
jgi:pSer/pThr/pTyr-binding forkhead associated (FHA) protein